MDAGAIAAQEWCFVKKGETARELWERALAPLGQKLLGEVIDYAKAHNSPAGQAAGRAVRDQGAELCRIAVGILTPVRSVNVRWNEFRSGRGTKLTSMCLDLWEQFSLPRRSKL